MFRPSLLPLIQLVALLFVASFCHADVISEPFSYPDQLDTSNPFRITTDGTVSGPVVGEFSEGRAIQAGIAGGILQLQTTAGSGIGDDFVGIFDIPGFSGNSGGPFGNFFSSPQNLDSSFGSIDVRLASGTNAARFRLLAEDSSSNEIATPDFSLSSSMTTYNFTDADFNILLGSSTSFDSTQVTQVSIEFFATPNSGNLDALLFEADNLILNTTIPEPGSVLVLMGFTMIGLTRRNRRTV